MSQYLVLIYDDESAWAKVDDAYRGEMLGKHEAFGTKHADAIVGGNALDYTNTATSIRGGSTVTDGPFAETKEALGGYYLIEAADLDAAIAIARDVPTISGGVEVRPIMVFS
jgi:hypothetical protein